MLIKLKFKNNSNNNKIFKKEKNSYFLWINKIIPIIESYHYIES